MTCTSSSQAHCDDCISCRVRADRSRFWIFSGALVIESMPTLESAILVALEIGGSHIEDSRQPTSHPDLGDIERTPIWTAPK